MKNIHASNAKNNNLYCYNKQTRGLKMKETSSPGAPPHEPTRVTRELVQLHAMVGTRQETIAAIIGLYPKTLRQYYLNALHQSKAKAYATNDDPLFNKAKSGHT